MSVPHLPPTAEALIADGTTVEIRPIATSDREAVLDLHANRMSAESRRLRFFGASRTAPRLAAERLCGAGRPGLLALGAWAGDDLVGEADCEILDDRPDAAELALAVADDWHRRGVATLLLEYLVHAARGRGVRVLEADTLAGNRAVHRVFADLGLPVHRRLEQGEIRVRVPLDEADEHYREAVDERGRRADVASLGPLLRPASVAVVGASRGRGRSGRPCCGRSARAASPGPCGRSIHARRRSRVSARTRRCAPCRPSRTLWCWPCLRPWWRAWPRSAAGRASGRWWYSPPASGRASRGS